MSCMNVDIESIGVWDTPCSVGLIPQRRPFTTSCTSVRTFRHALSLDEHRAKPKANHYNRPSEAERQHSSQSKKPENDVKEVWFAGCHGDVGKFVPEKGGHSLSRIPLRWMVRECFRTNTGIRFHTERFKDIGLDLDTLHLHANEDSPGLAHSPQVTPQSPSPHTWTSTPHSLNGSTNTGAPGSQVDVHVDEEDEETKDALCPIYDPLVHRPWWWLLEFLPIEQQKQLPDNKWEKYHSLNLGRARRIPADTDFFVHKSVQTRMEHLGYKPKVKVWAKQKPMFVD